MYTGEEIVFRVRPKIDNDQMDALRVEGFENHVVGHDWTRQLERSLLWVGAFDEDRLVGFVNLAWDGGVHAFMLDTAVAVTHRRRGIGTRLVREAIDAARAHGGIEWIHVDSDEVLMRDFYGPAGFTPTHAGTCNVGGPGTVKPMGFRGWPEEALEFYEGLEADNSKTYWTQHKSVYEEAVRRPMEELLAELAKEFGEGEDLPSVPRRSFREGQVAVQDADRGDAREGRVHLVRRAGPRLRVRDVRDGSRSARAVPHAPSMRTRRAGRSQKIVARPSGEGDRGVRARRAQVGAARLRQGAPACRSAPAQGPDRVAIVARRGMARDGEGEGPHRRVLPRPRSRWTGGWTRTSVRRRWRWDAAERTLVRACQGQG